MDALKHSEKKTPWLPGKLTVVAEIKGVQVT